MNKKEDCLVLLGTLGESLLGNLLTGKGKGIGINRAWERIAGAGYDNNKIDF